MKLACNIDDKCCNISMLIDPIKTSNVSRSWFKLYNNDSMAVLILLFSSPKVINDSSTSIFSSLPRFSMSSKTYLNVSCPCIPSILVLFYYIP